MEEKCKHDDTETESYTHEYYGKWFVVTVIKCAKCGEILNEKETDL